MTKTTLLHRQVQPAFVRNGVITSQVFMLFPKDNMKLSVDNGDMVDAKQSFDCFTSQGFKSVGVLAITVGECEDLNLNVIPDAIPEINEAHTLIKFPEISDKQLRKIASKLKEKAEARNWLYQPDC